MRLSVSAFVAFAIVAGTSRLAFAQTGGPAAGSWAIEGTAGSGSLLHFRSASSALIIGGSAYYNQLADGSGGTLNFVSSQLRLGIRRYGAERSSVRSFSTLSAVVGYNRANNPATNELQLGGAGELGAAYFFTPRVSLGGSGELTAAYGHTSGTGVQNRFAVTFPGVRLLGAVYF